MGALAEVVALNYCGGKRRVKEHMTGDEWGSHLFMAMVVMVEEFCTFVVIGPRFVGRGLLPRSIVVTPTVRESWTPNSEEHLNSQ